MKTSGLQSNNWNGYFDESKDSIMGNWKRCMICNKIPCDIIYDSSKIFTIWHCNNCKEDNYKHKNIFQKLLIFIDKKISKNDN